MKKLISIVLILLFTLLSLGGCKINSDELPFAHKKPSNFYYTNLLAKDLINLSSLKGSMYELNLHKEKPIDSEGFESVVTFFKSLSSKNFINKPDDLPTNPQFKVFLTTENEKFVINVYNEKYISIHPWEGIYQEDYIELSNIKLRYNIYELCKYYFR
jgi:hypothetical protein